MKKSLHVFVLLAMSNMAFSQVTYSTLTLNDGSPGHIGELKFGLSDVIFKSNPLGQHSGDLQIRNWNTAGTGYNDALFIKNNGNIGIGTTSPTELLELTNSEPSLRIRSTDPSKNASLKLDWGTANNSGLHISYHPNNAIGFIDNKYESVPGQVYGDIQFRRMLSSGLTPTMTLKAETGNVGIGTTDPKSKLSVNGQIRATEIKVMADIQTVPDYVFEPDYELRTLEETKAYITENKHLPEIPSASEMAENGIDLGDMNMRLLKKIEELTLYQIELLERLEKVEGELTQLKNKPKR